MPPKDAKKFEEFQSKVTALLNEYEYMFVVAPFFVDRLGNKHPIKAGGEIGAELQVNEKVAINVTENNGTDSGK